MEWILPAILGLLVASAVAQLLFSYFVCVIAKKDDQSELMQVLAWIPILQYAPMIVAGGGSVVAFILGCIGFFLSVIVLGAAAAFMGGAVAGGVGTVAVLFIVLVVLGYAGRILWTTAENRGLSGWVGILCLVPVVGLFAYPFIAVHDGWEAPNPVGFMIGLVLGIGSLVTPFQTVQAINQDGDFRAQLMQITQILEAGSSGQELSELAALRAQIESTQTHAVASADIAGSDASAVGSASDGSSAFTFYATPSGERAPSSSEYQAAFVYSARKQRGEAPSRPLPVRAKNDCPSDTELRTAHRNRGEEEWCQQSGGLRHGWFARYHENGQPESVGEYKNGLRVGVWTRFFPSGSVRAQAEFDAGLQEGWMVSFDESGSRTKAVYFEHGIASQD